MWDRADKIELMLLPLQRSCALRVIFAYRTMSTLVAFDIAGLKSFGLAIERERQYRFKLAGEMEIEEGRSVLDEGLV